MLALAALIVYFLEYLYRQAKGLKLRPVEACVATTAPNPCVCSYANEQFAVTVEFNERFCRVQPVVACKKYT